MSKSYEVGELVWWLMNRITKEELAVVVEKGGGRYNILFPCGKMLWVHPRHLMKMDKK